MSTIHITELNAVPTMGALLGSQGNTALLTQISKMAGNYFGSENDRYANQYKSFITTYIEPIRQANSDIKIAAQRLTMPDSIRPISTYEDLREIPPCMMVPVLTCDPVYSLLRQGRIDGWGFLAENLVDAKETYDRIIDTNGVVDFSEDPEDGETYIQHFEWDVFEDPDIEHDDRIALMETRDFVRKVLKESSLDPTDLDNLRG